MNEVVAVVLEVGVAVTGGGGVGKEEGNDWEGGGVEMRCVGDEK